MHKYLINRYLPVFFDFLYLLSIWVAGIAITIMAIIIPIGVIMRYIIGMGAQWPEPIALLLMLAFTFIGAAASYRAGGHISMDVLTNRLSIRIKKVLAIFCDALMLYVCGTILYFGIELVLNTMGQYIAALPWLPVGITYIPIPIGSLITILFIIEKFIFGSQAQRPIVKYEEQEAQ